MPTMKSSLLKLRKLFLICIFLSDYVENAGVPSEKSYGVMEDIVSQLKKSEASSNKTTEVEKVETRSSQEERNIHNNPQDKTKAFIITKPQVLQSTNDDKVLSTPNNENKRYEHIVIVGKNQDNPDKNKIRTNVQPISELIPDNNKQGNQVKSHGINIDSLKNLVNEFPNHVIEIQMEMNEPPPTKRPFSNVRLMSNQHKPLVKLVRTQEHSELDFHDRPVYMKDLMQVMQEFENKLKVTSQRPPVFQPMKMGRLSKRNLWELIGRNNEKKTEKEIVPLSPVNESNPKPPSDSKKQVKDINDVLDLIKKGVKVQFDITKPTDNNLDWIQIKVPNKDINDSISDSH